MIRMLHLVQDDKFIQTVIPAFEKRTDIISNYVYYRWKHNVPLQFVQKWEKIRVIDDCKEMIAELQSDNYDVLYLHSLSISLWQLLKYVPAEKKIIWWSWGYDIYSPGPYGIRNNFLTIKTILPITEAAQRNLNTVINKLKNLCISTIMGIMWHHYKRYIAQRIDYFRPVFHTEYDLMRLVKDFRAKEFYFPRLDSKIVNHADYPVNATEGSIQICNSATSVGNHLDVWESIKRFVPQERKIIMPLSYGSKQYASFVKKQIGSEHKNIETLEHFLPREEYFKLINQCTYFVHGAIRQHAMGNIYNALLSGRKVFLFKDSIIYKHLIKSGFIVFAIEEIDEDSFNTPLTMEQLNKNIMAREREIEFRNKIGRAVFAEIEESIRK